MHKIDNHDNEKDALTSVPLSPTQEGSSSNNLANSSTAHLTSPHNPDETYARYERAPFRRYSLLPGNNQNQENSVTRQPSKTSSLFRRFFQSDMAQDDQGVQRGKSGRSQKIQEGPDYSLAGKKKFSNNEDGEEYGYGSSRPKPQWGLGSTFPHNRSRWSKKKKNKGSRREGDEQSDSGKPQGQVGGGPSGHHGSPVRGRPMGETSGGPAGRGRNPEDEDQGGNSNFVEQLADGVNGYSQSGRHDSGQTLTEKDDDDDDDDEEEEPNRWFTLRRKLREPLAEWLSTMVMVLVGVGGNLQVKTSQGEAGSFSQEAAMWGLGTMMGIYIAGGISGAHCNPMVSINLMVFRGFPFYKCIIYICSQILGAICGVWIAYGIYEDAIMYFDPAKSSSTKGSGTAFFTLPQPFVTPWTAFFTDFTSAAVMSGTILAMGDDSNSPPGAGMHAFIIGLVGFAMASTLGYNTGPQTNPAKDLATRFVPNVVGYGSDMWKQGWWAEAWFAAVAGGLTGCLIYDLAIFEGPESPVNYPRIKRKQARQGTKGKWLKTGLFGFGKKKQAKEDLEAGDIGIMPRREERRFDGHGEK